LKKKILTVLKALVFLSLGLFLVWFALKDIKPEMRSQIRTAFANANYSWVFLSLIFGILSHLSRAIRWRIMLETLGHKPKLSNTFFAVMIGYMANYAPIPRLGEASRCGILTRYEKISFTESFGTVIAERLIDVLCLLLVFIITFFVQFDTINGLAHTLVLDKIVMKFAFLIAHPFLMIIAIIFSIAGIFLFIRFRNKSKEGFMNRVIHFIAGFWQGLKTVKHIRRPGAFIAHTFFIWLMYYVSLHVCFYALTETSNLGIKEGLPIFALGTLGVVFTPGGIGAYPLIVSFVMESFLITKPIAIAFPWIVWSAQFVLIICLGLISLILLPILNKEPNGNIKENAS
jgi:uncharacterized protein (TIRG00374 family)